MQRIEALRKIIQENLFVSTHAWKKLAERNTKERTLESIRKHIASNRNNCALDTKTGCIRIVHGGRRFIGPNGVLVTYMQPSRLTKLSVIKNHKLLHKFQPMEIDACESFWYGVLLQRKEQLVLPNIHPEDAEQLGTDLIYFYKEHKSKLKKY